MTDTLFPAGGSTRKNAALLLAEHLARPRDGQGGPCALVPDRELVELTASLVREYAARCGWSKTYAAGEGGAERLAGDAAELLEAFGLLRREPGSGGWRPLPAVARFAPAAPTERGGRP